MLHFSQTDTYRRDTSRPVIFTGGGQTVPEISLNLSKPYSLDASDHKLQLADSNDIAEVAHCKHLLSCPQGTKAAMHRYS